MLRGCEPVAVRATTCPVAVLTDDDAVVAVQRDEQARAVVREHEMAR